MKKRLNTILFILINISLIAIVLIMIRQQNNTTNFNNLLVEDGFIDLQSWNDDSNILLDGQWEFYPQKLLEPNDIESNKYESIKQLINVPDSWNKYLGGETAFGVGTYRVKIRVSQDAYYAFKIKRIRNSYKIYVNGEMVSEAGIVSEDPNLSKEESKFEIVSIRSKDKIVDLVIQVSNYKIAKGGIVNSIIFNKRTPIYNQNFYNVTMDISIIIPLITISGFFFIIYFQIKKEEYLINLSLLAFFLAIYIGLNEEQVFSLAINYSQRPRLIASIVSLLGASLNVNLLIRKIYDENYKKANFTFSNKYTLLCIALLPFVQYGTATLVSKFLQAFIITSFVVSLTEAIITILKSNLYKGSFQYYLTALMTNTFGLLVILVTLKGAIDLDIGKLTILLILLSILLLSLSATHIFKETYLRAERYAYKNNILNIQNDTYFNNINTEVKDLVSSFENNLNDLLLGKYGPINLSQNNLLLKLYGQSTNMSLLVDEIEHLSLQDYNFKERNVVEIDLFSLVSSLIILFDESFNKEIEIINNIPFNFNLIEGDYDNIKLALYHIIKSSYDEMENGFIEINTKVIKNQAFVSIVDNGPGIPASGIKHIFDPFYSENINLGGGLPLAKSLIVANKGSIKAYSKIDKGTTIKVRFKLSENTTITNNIESFKKIKANILFINDNYLDNDFNVISNLVENLIVANSLKDAIDTIKNEYLDIVIIGSNLKNIELTTLIDEIRELFSLSQLPILKIVPFQKKLHYAKLYGSSINDFIEKPLTPNEVIFHISKLLEINKSMEESLDREFKYYYSQISPHFLFNAINSIIGLSYESAADSRESLVALSIYLRAKLDIFRQNKFISLDDELELVNAYLHIEKLKNGDILEVNFNIEDDIEINIPPLTLQPIIENSFIHGFKDVNKKKILNINIYSKDNYVYIEIIDNGRGISKERIDEIINFKTNRFGLATVLNRIGLIKNSKFKIESEVGIGSKFIIRLPKERNNL